MQECFAAHRSSKDGKEHRYLSLAEMVRAAEGRRQRRLCYLTEWNDSPQGQSDGFVGTDHVVRVWSLRQLEYSVRPSSSCACYFKKPAELRSSSELWNGIEL